MPIDASRGPFDGAPDPDDLAFAGKGAIEAATPVVASTDKVAADKSLEDIEGAGSGDADARFTDVEVDKDPGAKSFDGDDPGELDGPDDKDALKDDLDDDDVEGADDDGTDIDKDGLDFEL
jgi:hypothetical protein